ncbi:MAG: twin-arginine translocase TatA/TatE family subunit [Ilumatobacteraceae bacterium]
MFNLSGSEIVFLLIIALVVLGPEKLPDAVRKFGKFYGEFKRMSFRLPDRAAQRARRADAGDA